ncbi:MAG TPA: nucleotidyltransferase family protein [Polyangia bacterium]|jgi:dTDP-glucose pyrophosphorylase
MTGLRATIVPVAGSIRDGLVAVDRGAAGIALAVDADGRLAGVATDGDIRRALLAGATLDDPLARVLIRDFVSVDARGGRADALDLMRARRIDAIPVIDGDGRPVALHLLQAFVAPAARPNWAVIMAGGEGRRLRPLTDSVPKPMLHVAGRPILERIVLHLVGAGVTRIFVSVNYLADVIEDHFGDGARFGGRIEYLRESEPLGTAGAIGLLPEPPVDPVLVLNGDLVTNVDVGALLALHAERGFAVTIGTRRYVHTVPFGCVTRDGERVTALDEKPSIVREVNTGIYALDPSVVGLVAPGVALTMPELIGRVIDRGDPVGAFEVEDDWIDVGQRDQLARAREGG